MKWFTPQTQAVQLLSSRTQPCFSISPRLISRQIPALFLPDNKRQARCGSSNGAQVTNNTNVRVMQTSETALLQPTELAAISGPPAHHAVFSYPHAGFTTFFAHSTGTIATESDQDHFCILFRPTLYSFSRPIMICTQTGCTKNNRVKMKRFADRLARPPITSSLPYLCLRTSCIA